MASLQPYLALAMIALGIGMVHQHFMLAERLTVAENITGCEPRRHGLLDTRAREEILEVCTAMALR